MQARSIICTKHGVKKTFGNRCLTIKTKTKMKKNLFMVAAVALMAMVSCNKEEVNQSGPEVAPEPSYYVEFTAQIDNEETPAPAQTQTRTAYDKTNNTTKWIDGDLISVNGKRFKIKELAADGLSATFINDEELGEDFGAPFTAIYPYNATEGSAVVPSTQTVTDGTFADESVVTVAYSAENNTLSFKHVTSVVKFQVATEGVSELTFSSSVALAGTISVNANEGGEPTYEATAGSKTITVKPESGTFATGVDYYVSVLPTVGDGTTKVDFAIKADNVTVKSGNVSFKRNTVMNAKEIEVKYVYLKPSLVWNIASPRFAVYYYGAGEGNNTWTSMSDTDGDGVYRTVVPEGSYTTLIYCRMNPDNATNDWKYKWNQTSDLDIPTGSSNAYIIKPLTWDNGEGSWSTLSTATSYKENTVYLKPSTDWKSDNAWFAICLCNGSKGVQWRKLSQLDDTFYGVELPTDFSYTNYKNILFVRMDPDKTALDWASKWNQTGDLSTTQLTTNGNYCCKIPTQNDWNVGTNVTWSKKLD